MESYFETPFIDFNTPLYNNKEEELFDDIFNSTPTKEWNCLSTDSSSGTMNYNNNNQFESKFMEFSTDFLIQDKIIEASKAENCFKFCEYLANQVTYQLDDFQYCQQLTSCFNDVFKGIIYFAGGEITNLKFFNVYPLNVISSLWIENKKVLSEKRLKGSENFSEADWESFFAPEEIAKKINKITSNYKDMDHFLSFKDIVAKELAISAYKRLLISCNATIINSLIFTRALKDQKVTSEISNIKDLVMMSRECWLFKHYNQENGKFEEYTSALLSADFLEKLQRSNQNYEMLLKFYVETGILESQSLVREAISRRFNFWTQTLWN